MASELKNLSAFEGSDVPDASTMKFGYRLGRMEPCYHSWFNERRL